MGVACVLVFCSIALFMAARERSRRILLGCLISLLTLYSATTAVTSALLSSPLVINIKTLLITCQNSTLSSLSDDCLLAKNLQKQVIDGNLQLFWFCCLGVALSSILLMGLGIWYTFELSFVEKKAAKHTRRHRRHKHQIPWHKLKIIGPVTDCGANKNTKPAGQGGKCPVMH